jgi:hypothetical protein
MVEVNVLSAPLVEPPGYSLSATASTENPCIHVRVFRNERQESFAVGYSLP